LDQHAFDLVEAAPKLADDAPRWHDDEIKRQAEDAKQRTVIDEDRESTMTKAPKNRNLVNLTRLSGDAARKLETILRFSATALRDKILLHRALLDPTILPYWRKL
jgi:hypothetical protein